MRATDERVRHRRRPHRGPVPIEAAGLRKAYGNRTVLDGVDLHVGPGQAVGLLGPNGAGKTTIVKSLFGMVHLDGGTATLLDRSVGDPRPGAPSATCPRSSSTRAGSTAGRSSRSTPGCSACRPPSAPEPWPTPSDW